MRLLSRSCDACAVLLAVLPCFAAQSGPSAPKQQTFTSTEAGYSVSYPAEWYRFPRSLPTLFILSFAPSQRARADVIPPGGASIAVTAPPDGVSTLEDWCARDLVPSETVLTKTPLALTRAADGTLVQAVEVDTTRGRPGVQKESIICYFAVSGHIFSARLNFWRGDKKSAEYVQTLHGIVTSLSSTSKEERR